MADGVSKVFTFTQIMGDSAMNMVGMYGYGLLEVKAIPASNVIVQSYYPHSGSIGFATRVSFSGPGQFGDWRKMTGVP